ncbi:hypothetical protein ACFCXP_11180 [Streptomyces niveus]|uniref:hypothetical protein n=1 Tax=Streptomyces niveus TaxID=193462 RepID=UPI0035E14D30
MYRAKETFWAPDNRRVVKGDLVAAHDTVMQGREELFEAVVIPQALAPDPKTARAGQTDDGDGGQPPTPAPAPPPAPAAKKTAAKKTTTAPRTPTGGTAK